MRGEGCIKGCAHVDKWYVSNRNYLSTSKCGAGDLVLRVMHM